MTFSVALVVVGALSVNANAQWGRFGPTHGSHHGAHSQPSLGLQIGGLGVHVSGYAPRGYTTQRYSVPHHSVSRYSTRGYSSYGYRSARPVWHDTTHLDYHAPSVVRHGSHYHVVPGHYDVHRTGHYDYH